MRCPTCQIDAVAGVGFHIDWQATPLGDGPERIDATGAFVEDVILASIQRLRSYQGEDGESSGRFRCWENAQAIVKLEEALHWCEHRTRDRERRGVEGSHQNDHGVKPADHHPHPADAPSS